jgi:hypothetical protein
MKLAQLQEARYAGIHPAVTTVEKALMSGDELELELGEVDLEEVVKAFTRVFGEPDEVFNNTPGRFDGASWYNINYNGNTYGIDVAEQRLSATHRNVWVQILD